MAKQAADAYNDMADTEKQFVAEEKKNEELREKLGELMVENKKLKATLKDLGVQL